jgi:DNA-binding CsgD family transcriptional regulator
MKPCLPCPETAEISHLFALAAQTVARLALPVLPEADEDDWKAIALQAALRATRSYRPELGWARRTWIINKIRWALKDALRDWDPAGRTARQRWRDYEEQQAAYAAGQRPEPPEEPPPLRERILSLEELLIENEDGVSHVFDRAEHLALADGWSEEQVVTQLALRSALRRLTQEQRDVLSGRMEGETFLALGRRSGISESGAFQRYQEAVLALRQILGVTPEPPALPLTPDYAGRPRRETVRHREVSALMAAGLSPTEIAAQLAAPRPTVYTWIWEARRLGLLPPIAGAARAADPDPVLRLHAEGRSYAEIAAALSLSHQQVGRLIRRAQLEGRLPLREPRPSRQERAAAILQLQREGHSQAQIAAQLGIALKTVANILGKIRREARP